MNVTAEKRQTAVVGRLLLGDVIEDTDGFYEVMSQPRSYAQGVVTVGLRRVDGTNATRRRDYEYPSETRFRLVK